MENMQITAVHHHGYTTWVDANGGEEQLIIIGTFGQSGQAAIRVLATTIDGGHLGDEHGVEELESVPYGTESMERTQERVVEAIQKWGTSKETAQKIWSRVFGNE